MDEDDLSGERGCFFKDGKRRTGIENIVIVTATKAPEGAKLYCI